MFSICLKGIFDVDGALITDGEIVFTSVHSTVPSLSSSCSGISPSFAPVTASIQLRASASITGSNLAAAFAASSLSMPYRTWPFWSSSAESAFLYAPLPPIVLCDDVPLCDAIWRASKFIWECCVESARLRRRLRCEWSPRHVRAV